MWTLIKSLLLKWALLRTLLRVLGSLGWLLPLAFVLKAVGIPLLLLLAVLAIPLFVVLAVIGLPFLLVMLVGGALLSLTMWIVSLGLVALKIALPVLLVVWVIRWLTRNPERPAGGDSGPTGGTG